MKYTSHLKQLSVDMFRSSFDELDKNNRSIKTYIYVIYKLPLQYEVQGGCYLQR